MSLMLQEVDFLNKNYIVNINQFKIKYHEKNHLHHFKFNLINFL